MLNICLLLNVCIASAGVADEGKPRPDEAAAAPETILLKIRVVNEDGEPVKNAKITPSGLRTRVESGGYYFWVEDRHGKRPTVLTDESGVADVRCPKYVIEKLETGEITWLVDHEDYMLFRDERLVDDDPAQIVLQRGRRIAVFAIDAETKEAVTENLHASLSGHGGPGEWNIASNGMLMSHAVDLKRTMVRVFQFPEGLPTKFSDPINLSDQNERKRILLRDVALRVGTRIEGRIDEAVPRPVKNGTVSIRVVDEAKPDDWDSKLSWRDWTTINEDGSFVFESLPRGSVVQMTAVCDGWLSTDPTVEEVSSVGIKPTRLQHRDFGVLPQVAELLGDRITPVVRMERGAKCRITVLSPDGKPLEGAAVSMSPNQKWLDGVSQIVGDGHNVRKSHRLTDDQRATMWSWDKRRFLTGLGVRPPAPNRYFRKTTNADGVAVIDTLPGGSSDAPQSQPVGVEHDKYEQSIGGVQGLSREVKVLLIRGETAEVMIRMEEKGTNTIGE